LKNGISFALGPKKKKPLDIHGDVLGTATLAGDRWRIAHDIIKLMMFRIAKYLDVIIQMEVYGLFVKYLSPRARTALNNMKEYERRRQIIIPDLLTKNPPEGSPLGNPQMYEVKRLHAAFTVRADGTEVRNNYYGGNYDSIGGAEKRQNHVVKEYTDKAKKADKNFGEDGKTDVEDFLKTMPPVMGLVVGCFGELSPNFDVLIDGFAYEGALNKAHMFTSSRDPIKAKEIIAWWMKKRLSRVAMATAAQCRIDAMGYVGEAATAAAERSHASREEAEGWAYDKERRRREREGSAYSYF
jgi:hypothetical protein